MADRYRNAPWVAGLLLLLLAVAAPANPRSQQAASGADKKFSGTVDSVTLRECEICKCVEVSLVLKTAAGRFEVRLGPKAFLEEHDFFISRGDSIVVTGLQFTERGREIVLANEVDKGGEHLLLRGKYGKPAWIEAQRHTCPVCGN